MQAMHPDGFPFHQFETLNTSVVEHIGFRKLSF